MKWFKHISDSLDDPMIYSLMTEFGSDGYLVFFGVLEKYSREFSPENGWKLVIKLSFFRGKFLISQNKIKKILHKIPKWDVAFTGNDVSIYIPKFIQLLDNYTRNTNPIKQDETCKSLASDWQETCQPLKKKEERIKNKEEHIAISIPEWIKKETWDSFIEMRKSISAKPTPKAIILLISKLERLRNEGNDPQKVLEQSIMNNYKGVFPLKEGGNGNGGIRTGRSDPRDKNLQSREDAECEANRLIWEAAKKSSSSKAGGVSGNDDAPNFSG